MSDFVEHFVGIGRKEGGKEGRGNGTGRMTVREVKIEVWSWMKLRI